MSTAEAKAPFSLAEGLLADDLEAWNAAGRPAAQPSYPPRSAAEARRNIAGSYAANAARVNADTDEKRSERTARRREKQRADRAEARVFESTVPTEILKAGENAVGDYLTAQGRPWPRRRVVMHAVRRAQLRATEAAA